MAHTFHEYLLLIQFVTIDEAGVRLGSVFKKLSLTILLLNATKFVYPLTNLHEPYVKMCIVKVSVCIFNSNLQIGPPQQSLNTDIKRNTKPLTRKLVIWILSLSVAQLIRTSRCTTKDWPATYGSPFVYIGQAIEARQSSKDMALKISP